MRAFVAIASILIMLLSVGSATAAPPPGYSLCIYDDWIRGYCELFTRMPLQALLHPNKTCSEEDLNAGQCILRSELRNRVRHHTCREDSVLAGLDPDKCGPLSEADKRLLAKRKLAAGGTQKQVAADHAKSGSQALPSANAPSATPIDPTDLNQRMELWRKQVKFCDTEGHVVPQSNGAFPTKVDDDETKYKEPEPCDDGDMLLFNGLLCAVGEDVGCDAVRDSQNPATGQWWRSPAIMKRGQDKADQPNLNSDQVLGLLLYVLQTHDGTRFRKWIEWIRPMGIPKRFCSLRDDGVNNCLFKPEDCSLIFLVGSTVGEQAAAASICPPGDILANLLPIPPIPSVDNVFSAYDHLVADYNAYNSGINNLQKLIGLDIVPPDPLPPMPTLSNTRAQAKSLADGLQNLQDLLVPTDMGEKAAAYFFSSLNVTANALVAGAGQGGGKAPSARHLAATAIFLLKKYQVTDPGLDGAALKLASQAPDNAYFAYLAQGHTAKVEAMIRDACPYDPASTTARYQWVWERDVSVDAGKQSMFWDCIFAADLVLHGVNPPAGLMGSQITDFLPGLLRSWSNFKSGLDDLTNVIKTLLDENGRLKDVVASLKQQLDHLRSMVGAVADKSIPKVDKNGITIPPPPGTIGPTVSIQKNGNVHVSIGGHKLF
ncbi:hypothetical protein [Rhizobium sp. A37_96]